MSSATNQRTISVPEDLLLQLQRWMTDQLQLSAESNIANSGDGVAMLEKLRQICEQQQEADSNETHNETTKANDDVSASIEELTTEIIDEAAELNRVLRNAGERWIARRKAREEKERWRRRQACWCSRLWDKCPGYHWDSCYKWTGPFCDYCEMCDFIKIDRMDDNQHLKCLMDEILERYE